MPGFHHRLFNFLGDVVERTPIIRLALSLLGLWLLFSFVLWWVEHDAAGYWSVAAFSIAGRRRVLDRPGYGLPHPTGRTTGS